jgi:hypothetical protein
MSTDSEQCVHPRGARRSESQGSAGSGDETGLYISFDDGENWRSFQLNLPITPITDLQFHKREELGSARRAILLALTMSAYSTS